MGFYGNITYNTYGLQEKSVKPEHLFESYWRTIPVYKAIGQIGLRTILQLNVVTADQKDIWEDQWAKAEKTCFKFYFPNVTENTTLRKLYGNGYLLGWVRKNTLEMADWTSSNNWTLYMIALNGERVGQIFSYPLSPINNEIELSAEDIDSTTDEKGKQSNWLNDYLEGPIITTPLIRNQSITTDKIANDAITTDKIGDYQVSTIKIANDAITGGEGGKIKQSTITAFNIASYTIVGGVEGNIAEKTITDYNIADKAITKEKIEDNAITAEKITNGAITKEKMNNSDSYNAFFIPIESFSSTDELKSYLSTHLSLGYIFYFRITEDFATLQRGFYKGEIVTIGLSMDIGGLKTTKIDGGRIQWWYISDAGIFSELPMNDCSQWSINSFIKLPKPDAIVPHQIVEIGTLKGYTTTDGTVPELFLCTEKSSDGTTFWTSISVN